MASKSLCLIEVIYQSTLDQSTHSIRRISDIWGDKMRAEQRAGAVVKGERRGGVEARRFCSRAKMV